MEDPPQSETDGKLVPEYESPPPRQSSRDPVTRFIATVVVVGVILSLAARVFLLDEAGGGVVAGIVVWGVAAFIAGLELVLSRGR